DYARVESRGPTLQMRNVDVQRLLDDCIAFVEPEATKRRLVMRVVMAPGAPIHFVTDELQLRQILMNLLGNSVKYTLQGSIELRVSGDESDLRIEVADTGIGIPEGRRHLLFREYERFGTEKTGIEGTGLGLAIAHRLARRLGGHLGHRDNPVGGSVFWLEIPAGAPAAEDVAAAASIAETAIALRVLLVDDSVVNREIAAGYLRKSGHTVIEASDGSDAVELAGAHDFDVVLMDMRMSGMNGLEATRRIRALPAPRGKVPIVAVTANALDEHAEECRRAGMNDHLAKPFAQADLLAVVVRAAARRRVFDTAGLAQVASAIGEEEAERLLDCLGLRIEALLRRLDDPTKVPSREELADLAHELAGSGGTLGFQRLASAARRYAVAVRSGAADGRDLAGEAKNVLTALQRRRSLETLLSV
ncbi:MAG TPA: response regulator, partial [Acetobacteraceae bacterium]|nr:response regulator [Acetobacteraceae bacterium]